MVQKLTGRKTITEKLVWASIMYLSHLKMGCFTEIGVARWGKRRMDVLAISLKGCITGVEVKSGLADFKSDTKYTDYLPYCHKMYFCVTDPSIFTSDNILQFKTLGIGILYLAPSGYLKVYLRCTKRVMKKKAKREILYRMAWRAATYSVRTGVRRCKTVLNPE